MQQKIDISAQGGFNPRKNQALKKGLIIGVIVVVGIIIYRGIKKKNWFAQMGNLDVFQGGDVGNTTQSSNPDMFQIEGFNAFQRAEQLKEAFLKDDGWILGATDEELIWNTLDGLSSNEIRAVEEMFNKHFRSDMDGMSLLQSFHDELSGSELDRALAYMEY